MKSKAYRLPDGYTFVESIGRTYRQIKDPIGSMCESMEAFGGTYAVHLGLTRFIVTQDPGFIDYVLKANHRNYHKSEFQTKRLGRFLGNGLLTSNGDYWLRQRRLIQPGFHQERIRGLYDIIHATCEDFVRTCPVSDAVDIYAHTNKVAFSIVINTLFNVAIGEGIRRELADFVYDTQHFVIKDIRNPHKSWWYRLSGEAAAHDRQALRARAIIRDLIRERRNSRGLKGDLLDMLLDARYEDTGEGMTEDQVIDEILVLIIAGHETTANALAWALYLLSAHPGELAKAREAAMSLNPAESVQSPVLLAVIREAMRLYPPAWIVDRVALADDAYKDYRYPANTIVILFFYGLHRDPRYWESPGEFRPARFLDGDLREIGKHYFPFGAGPRLCIGNGFAMAEMAIFLRAFLRAFDISTTGAVPRVNALVTLKPEGLSLRVTRH